ncbi:MAG: hypothetical protein JWM74_3377 [Myxococcaceae bacterium]|nr:hypothetical protein [Myxococcaceae bacterium]
MRRGSLRLMGLMKPTLLCLVASFLLVFVGCSASEDGAGSTPTTADGGATEDGAAPEDDAGPAAPSCKGCVEESGCVTKPTGKHCGLTGTAGEACVDCTAIGNDHACVQGKCGCLTDNDCSGSLVCDTSAHKCTTRCTSGSCATGCCNASGFCSAGTAAETCGASGTCTDCSKNFTGKACMGDGKCGCNTAADCGAGYACDTTTHACTQACSATSACNGGCCDMTTSKCTGGYQTATCGKSGAACTSCVGAAAGPSCISSTGSCGCSSYTDCPANMACDATTHLCTTKCSATQYCNGGCCNGTTCAAGTDNASCGANFTMCKACSGLNEGPTCGATKKCGCSVPADCQGGSTCALKNGSKVCCLPKGAFSATAGNCCNSVTINQICQ